MGRYGAYKDFDLYYSSSPFVIPARYDLFIFEWVLKSNACSSTQKCYVLAVVALEGTNMSF